MTVFDTKSRISGFTIIELITALVVSFVVLTAVVTLAFAISSAYDCTGDINEKQARIRYTTIRISELIKYSELICDASPDGLVIWKADDNNDNQINVSEIAYIETNNGKCLRLLQFDSSYRSDPALSLPLIRSVYIKTLLKSRYKVTYTMLIEECSNVNIKLDRYPPYTRHVNISFDIEENHLKRTCRISSTLRCHMSSLINTYGSLSGRDDDLP